MYMVRSVSALHQLQVTQITRRSSVKKVFLGILQNSHEKTCASLFFNKVAG